MKPDDKIVYHQNPKRRSAEKKVSSARPKNTIFKNDNSLRKTNACLVVEVFETVLHFAEATCSSLRRSEDV